MSQMQLYPGEKEGREWIGMYLGSRSQQGNATDSTHFHLLPGAPCRLLRR